MILIWNDVFYGNLMSVSLRCFFLMYLLKALFILENRANRSINQLINKTINHQYTYCINEHQNWLFNQSINQSTNQSVNQSINTYLLKVQPWYHGQTHGLGYGNSQHDSVFLPGLQPNGRTANHVHTDHGEGNAVSSSMNSKGHTANHVDTDHM